MRRGRLRFGQGQVFSRHESALPLVRAVKRGHAFFNLPDMDFGLRDAAFVPFFGVQAATLLAPSRMARSLKMVVQSEIRANPAQYLWVHKRFKTRPPGEASFYD